MRREGIVAESVSAIHLQQFGHGQSNPTYLVKVRAQSNDFNLVYIKLRCASLSCVRVAGLQAGAQEMVLRKQPPGKLLASAHAVDREFEVMRALMSTSVAVPAMLALCRDPSVLGTTFFLMSFVDGKLMLDPNMPAFEASQRQAAYSSMGGVLLDLSGDLPLQCLWKNNSAPCT